MNPLFIVLGIVGLLVLLVVYAVVVVSRDLARIWDADEEDMGL